MDIHPYVIKSTISHKTFETKSSFHVKYHTTKIEKKHATGKL